MVRSLVIAAVFAVAATGSALLTQAPAQRGTIVRIDAATGEITIRMEDGKKREFLVVNETRGMTIDGAVSRDALTTRAFKLWILVGFSVADYGDMQPILEGIRALDLAVDGNADERALAASARPTRTPGPGAP